MIYISDAVNKQVEKTGFRERVVIKWCQTPKQDYAGGLIVELFGCPAEEMYAGILKSVNYVKSICER